MHADAVHQGLFRPPVPSPSPASSGYLAAHRPAPAAIDSSTPKRKRNGDGDVTHTFYYGDDCRDHRAAVLGSAGHHLARAYTLAGQLGTPQVVADDALGESMYSDANYRKCLGSKRPREEVDAADAAGPTSLYTLPAQPLPSRRWSAAAMSTIGGVVGKVWEFCKAGAFKGFYAGGGAAHEMAAWEEEWRCGAACAPGHGHGHWASRPLPHGDIHFRCEVEDGHVLGTGPSTPTARPAKRRQTGPADELGQNWVMVQEAGVHRSTTGRRIAAGTATPRRAHVHERAAPASPVLDTRRPASSASFASPRPSSASRAYPTASASPTCHGRSAASHSRRRSMIPLPSQPSSSRQRAHSNASTATCTAPEGRERDVNVRLDASPRLDAEARMLAKRRRVEERNTDVRMTAFNKKLQDMIRQGQEALETTIEIGSNGNQGLAGWEDDDECI
ncbi:hypothetical protein DCS_02523 [Drechmeria coniospora]|uniref:Uncharacterized protein n=1 Tax=Drechmeria coniospora TaxID=98403 RepID=A0A151GWD5_DRECN|nr:hypothetical protein DCS_02523 [Drechmeria coniospora]KYK61381.1 hypothetical protein DCS_02523 [Drechmeria coniospora]